MNQWHPLGAKYPTDQYYPGGVQKSFTPAFLARVEHHLARIKDGRGRDWSWYEAAQEPSQRHVRDVKAIWEEHEKQNLNGRQYWEEGKGPIRHWGPRVKAHNKYYTPRTRPGGDPQDRSSLGQPVGNAVVKEHFEDEREFISYWDKRAQ